jgi:tRNA A37 threonylcarbamoyladenosine synthetase subunit TsaC/SUA5/YrdC
MTLTMGTPLSELARNVVDTARRGGLSLVPLDVAYAVFGNSKAGISRIFEAKKRSFKRQNGMVGDLAMSEALHVLDSQPRTIIESLVRDYDLPFSVVAPFRRYHSMFEAVDPFVMDRSTRNGTLDLLLNAGALHRELARQSLEHGVPLFGSSANISLAGSRYRLEDVEAEVREIAALEIDGGLVKFANSAGVSSTIIDFGEYRILRAGVCCDQLIDIFERRFDITLLHAEPQA